MLDEILNKVRESLNSLQSREQEFITVAQSMPPTRDIVGALMAPGMSVIAEFKKASPSRGVMNADMDPAERALLYQKGGAAAISVLTEPHYFFGSPQDLQTVRGAVDLPVLRKDFILDPVQVWESRAMGADAILLIAAALEPGQLLELLQSATQAGLSVLVEVHNRAEAEMIPLEEVHMVGVNNRDLRTFQVDLATAEDTFSVLKDVKVKVAESGIHSPHDALRLHAVGYDALLVGEYLTRSSDPAAALAGLRGTQ